MFAIRLPIVETEEFFEYREAHCSGMMVGIILHRRDPTFSDMLSYFYFTAALQKKNKKDAVFQCNSGHLVVGFHHGKVFFTPTAVFFSYDNASIKDF